MARRTRKRALWGAATNNGKGIAGVNWSASLLSYNIGKKVTKTVKKYPNGLQITKDFVFLDAGAVGPAINNAVNAGAKTILLPLNWVQRTHIPNITTPNLQFHPCCKATNLVIIFTDITKIGHSIISAFKSNDNFISAIDATINAYKDGTVVVGKALEYDGIGIGFPANLASDHVVFTVGAADANNQPFQYSGTPDGQVEQFFTDRPITLYSLSSWGAVASGYYIADIDKVTFTIPWFHLRAMICGTM